MAKPFHYGGQAVLEGVMMRGPNRVKTAVRKSDGEIVTRTDPLGQIYSGTLRKTPFIRGFFALLETLILGIRALMFSANVAVEEELEQEPKPIIIWIPVVFGLAMGIGLFVLLPMFITHYGVDRLVDSAIISNLVDGVLRIVILVAYMASMSLLPDIRRVFAYHGAEHKTVNAYEAGEPLNVETVQKYNTAHTRCGTGFLLIVLFIAILVFIFTGQPAIWIRLLIRLAFLPVIAAFAYELIHFTADRKDSLWVRVIMKPGMTLQSLTTRQPDDEMVEVAIEALSGVLEPEEEQQDIKQVT